MYKHLLIFVVLFAIQGCTLNGRVQQESAQQIDLKKVYPKYLISKYSFNDGRPDFGNRLDKYQSMAYERGGIAQKKRENDLKVIDEQRRALVVAEARVKEARRELQGEVSNRRKVEIEISAAKKDLAKKPEDANLAKKVDELSLISQDFDDFVNSRRNELEEAENNRKRLADDLSSLLNRDYVALADTERREFRNEMINDFLTIADFYYYEFKDTLLNGRAGGDTLLDVTELALSTATTLTGGVTSKTNLGAASTFLKGTRSSVDKNFFVQQTLSSIINGIELRRQQDRLEIIRKMHLSTDQYPLSQALSDVQLYQSRASLVSGSMAVANSTAEKIADIEKELQQADLK